MRISIVTPSFRNSDWLKLCVASVADQAGVEVEHIVQDAQSDDGTQEWLARDRRVQAYFEKDQGMYDAINRGWRRAKGEILAYLNCDEQYLPGALRAVEEFFRRRPQTDVVFADTVVVDKQGQFICCRKSLVPWKNADVGLQAGHQQLDLHPPAGAGPARAFLRYAMALLGRQGVDGRNGAPRAEHGSLAPFHLVIRRHRRKHVSGPERPARDGERDGDGPRLGPASETARCASSTACAACATVIYWQKPFTYSIYTLAQPDRRVDFPVAKPTAIWWTRH